MKYRRIDVDDELVAEVFRLRRIGDACFMVAFAAFSFFVWHMWPLAAAACMFSLLTLTYHVFTERNLGERVLTGVFYVALLFVVITGSASAYLDLGLVSPDGPSDKPPQRVTDYADALYFSVVTCTTTGFGDIRPLPPARAWAAGEALFGYFHLALLVSYITLNLQAYSSHNQCEQPNPAMRTRGKLA